MVKKNVNWYHTLATKKNGRYLSDGTGGTHAKHLWGCKEGHQWTAVAFSVQQGHWCPKCARNKPYNINDYRALANRRKGTYLGSGIGGVASKHLFECEEGHQFKMRAADVQQGKWCAECAGLKPKDINWYRQLATSKNGKYLGDGVGGIMAKHPFECEEGHQWEAPAHDVQQGHWCPKCAGKKPYNIDDYHALAAKHKGGKYLGNGIGGVASKHLWECNYSHQFKMRAADVQQGKWCARCAHQVSKPEIEIFKYILIKYPDTLSGNRGLLRNKNFQLDVYVPSIKKAIEYDGYRWHKSKWAVARGFPERDTRKNQQCLEAGIDLLRIPESEFLKDKEYVFRQVDAFLKQTPTPSELLEQLKPQSE